jgi:hypothetical protein
MVPFFGSHDSFGKVAFKAAIIAVTIIGSGLTLAHSSKIAACIGLSFLKPDVESRIHMSIS